MIIDRVLEILSLPITAVIGEIPKPYNPYTCFLPFKQNLEYEFLLVTELSEFARRRIELLVPFSSEEEEICKRLINKKQVMGLDSLCISGMTKIPDFKTRLISAEMAKQYPFKTLYIPMHAIVTPLAKEENLIIKEADFSCKSDRYAEVFGQPRKLRD